MRKDKEIQAHCRQAFDTVLQRIYLDGYSDGSSEAHDQYARQANKKRTLDLDKECLAAEQEWRTVDFYFQDEKIKAFSEAIVALLADLRTNRCSKKKRLNLANELELLSDQLRQRRDEQAFEIMFRDKWFDGPLNRQLCIGHPNNPIHNVRHCEKLRRSLWQPLPSIRRPLNGSDLGL